MILNIMLWELEVSIYTSSSFSRLSETSQRAEKFNLIWMLALNGQIEFQVEFRAVPMSSRRLRTMNTIECVFIPSFFLWAWSAVELFMIHKWRKLLKNQNFCPQHDEFIEVFLTCENDGCLQNSLEHKTFLLLCSTDYDLNTATLCNLLSNVLSANHARYLNDDEADFRVRLAYVDVGLGLSQTRLQRRNTTNNFPHGPKGLKLFSR